MLDLYVIFNLNIWFLRYSFFSVFLYLLDIRLISNVELVKKNIFFYSVGNHAVQLMATFPQRNVRYHEFPIIYSLSYCRCYQCFVQKLSAVPILSILFPIFSSIKFSIPGFIMRSLIHLDLFFAGCKK